MRLGKVFRAAPTDAARSGARVLHVLVSGLQASARACVTAAMAALLLLSVGQVIDRYLVKSSFDAYDQLARLCLVWLTFVGIALGVRERANIRIELLEHLLPGVGTRVLASALDAVVLLTALYVLLKGWVLLDIGSYQAVMGTPLSYEVVYAGLLVGMALLVLFLGLRLAGCAAEAPVSPSGDHGP